MEAGWVVGSVLYWVQAEAVRGTPSPNPGSPAPQLTRRTNLRPPSHLALTLTLTPTPPSPSPWPPILHYPPISTRVRSPPAHLPRARTRPKVDYYGTPTPLKSLASVSAPDAATLLVSVYDKGAVTSVEKALSAADLGASPSSDGNNVRIAIPPLTAERRKALAKTVSGMGEEGKVAVRGVRQGAMKAVRRVFCFWGVSRAGWRVWDWFGAGCRRLGAAQATTRASKPLRRRAPQPAPRPTPAPLDNTHPFVAPDCRCGQVEDRPTVRRPQGDAGEGGASVDRLVRQAGTMTSGFWWGCVWESHGSGRRVGARLGRPPGPPLTPPLPPTFLRVPRWMPLSRPNRTS